MKRIIVHRRSRYRTTRLSLALLTLLGSTAALAQSAETDPVERQLVVLFDPTNAASPVPDILVESVIAKDARKQQLSASIGTPLHAEKSLQNVKSLDASAAATDPLAPRALLDRYVTLTYASPVDAAFARTLLAADPRVLSVETNRRYRVSATPSDAFFGPAFLGSPPASYQWGMQAMNFPTAWDKERGFAYIAAIDSGLPQHYPTGTVHPDLQQNYRSQFSRNFRPGIPTPDVHDGVGHGSHVAGILAATPQFGPFGHDPSSDGSGGGSSDIDRSTGVAGACWTCSLSMLAVNGMDPPNIAAAITFAADHGLQAVNMSFGDAYDSPQFSTCTPPNTYAAMCQAIAYAAQRQVVLVGASGNRNDNRVQFPANQADVIAVGGIEYSNATISGYTFKGKFWQLGYGNGNSCSSGVYGDECGSNYGSELYVVAPAKDVMSTIGLGLDFANPNYNANIRCGDQFPGGAATLDYYGNCTGTSMAAPHVTGLVGLMRSANPLADPFWIRAWIGAYTTGCENWDLKCGAGIPNAASSVQAALGHANAVNRRTPLFSFYSTDATNHFYTTAPQMAASALVKGLLLPQPGPQPPYTPDPTKYVAYSAIGVSIPSYTAFPLPTCSFSPCPTNTPKAIASIFTTHVSPLDGSALTPLYRYSFACEEVDSGVCANAKHVSHVYATNPNQTTSYYPSEHGYWTSVGYQLDGIEGYVFPKNIAQPAGTLRLCRKYDAARDDYVLFLAGPSDKFPCSATSDGYTGGNYQPVAGIDWIGYAYPPSDPQPVCPVGVSCT